MKQTADNQTRLIEAILAGNVEEHGEVVNIVLDSFVLERELLIRRGRYVESVLIKHGRLTNRSILTRGERRY